MYQEFCNNVKTRHSMTTVTTANTMVFPARSGSTQSSTIFIPPNIVAQSKSYQHGTPDLDNYLCDQLTPKHFEMYENTLKMRFNVQDTYPIDFDDIWTMLGYAKKANAKYLLDQMTRGDTTMYKMIPVVSEERGRPMEKIYLTFDLAYRFALKASTDKADEIADFFITTWKTIQDYYILSMYMQQQRSIVDISVHVDTKYVVYIADLGVPFRDGHQFLIGYAHDIEQYFPMLKRVFKRAKLIQTHQCMNSDQFIRTFLSHALVQSRLTQFCYNLAYINIFTLDDEFNLPMCLCVFSELCREFTNTPLLGNGTRTQQLTSTQERETQQKDAELQHAIQVEKSRQEDLRLKDAELQHAIQVEKSRQDDLRQKDAELQHAIQLEKTKQEELRLKDAELQHAIQLEKIKQEELRLKDAELELGRKLEMEREITKRAEHERLIQLELEKEKSRQIEQQLELQRLLSIPLPPSPVLLEHTKVPSPPDLVEQVQQQQGERGKPETWPPIRTMFVPVGTCTKEFYVSEFFKRFTLPTMGFNTSCKEIQKEFNNWSKQEGLGLTFEVSTQFAGVLAKITPIATKIRCHSSGNEQKGATDTKLVPMVV